MNFENLCINCMREKGEYDVVCPHCHFDQNTYEMPPHVLPPYSVLNGRYLTGRVLGSGGFGITYIAMDMILERKVAVKEFFVRGVMYRDSTASDTVSVSTDSMGTEERFYYESRLKFEQEAKILAHLDELPGIVKVFDFFLENDTVYMVQEFLDGITLKKYVENHNGRLPSEQVVQKLASVMESLQQVHEHGILHRDISPDNIMVMEDGSMKLLDFGGAKVNLNHEYSSLVLQKEGYTPIEQRHQDGKQGAWTDVYAMAATMYYCICGIVPVDSVKRSDKDTLKNRRSWE